MQEADAAYLQVDANRLANPEEALEAKELAGLVWQAAAALDPKQYSLLDLHLRQGLDSGEIATMLGKSKNSAYIMLSRLRASVEDSIAAFIMARRGRQECAGLNELLEGPRAASFNADMKKAVARHIEGCSTCQGQRRKLVSPTEILGAFAAVPVPLGLKQQAMAKILGQWALLAGSEAAKAGGFLSHLLHPFGAATGGAKQAGWFAGWKAAALVAGTVVVAAGATGGALIYSGALGGGQSGQQSLASKLPTATPVPDNLTADQLRLLILGAAGNVNDVKLDQHSRGTTRIYTETESAMLFTYFPGSPPLNPTDKVDFLFVRGGKEYWRVNDGPWRYDPDRELTPPSRFPENAAIVELPVGGQQTYSPGGAGAGSTTLTVTDLSISAAASRGANRCWALTVTEASRYVVFGSPDFEVEAQDILTACEPDFLVTARTVHYVSPSGSDDIVYDNHRYNTGEVLEVPTQAVEVHCQQYSNGSSLEIDTCMYK